MLRLATDADFNGKVLRGLRRREPALDIVRVQDVGLREAADADILAWAASEGRIVLSHDRHTMTDAAYERISSALAMPGALIIRDGPIGKMIDEILVVALCSEQDEWKDRVVFLPL